MQFCSSALHSVLRFLGKANFVHFMLDSELIVVASPLTDLRRDLDHTCSLFIHVNRLGSCCECCFTHQKLIKCFKAVTILLGCTLCSSSMKFSAGKPTQARKTLMMHYEFLTGKRKEINIDPGSEDTPRNRNTCLWAPRAFTTGVPGGTRGAFMR
jgi:hypothetical protein